MFGATTTTPAFSFSPSTTSSNFQSSTAPNSGFSFSTNPTPSFSFNTTTPSTTTTNFATNPAPTNSFSFPSNQTTPSTSFNFSNTTPNNNFSTAPNNNFSAAPNNNFSAAPNTNFSSFSAGNSTSTPNFSSSNFLNTKPGPNLPNVSGDTRFEDIPQEWKNELIRIQGLINDARNKSDELSQRKLDPILKIREDIKIISEKQNSLYHSLELDLKSITNFRAEVNVSTSTTELFQGYLQRYRTNQYNISSFNSTHYWVNLINSFERKMQLYKLKIEEIYEYINSSKNSVSLPMIYETIKNQHQSMLYNASKFYELQDQFTRLKEEFITYRRRYHNDTEDHFLAADKREKSKYLRIEGPTTPSLPQTSSQQPPYSSTTTAPLSTSQYQFQPSPFPTSSVTSTPSGFNLTTNSVPTTPSTPTTVTFYGNSSTPSTNTPNTGIFSGTSLTPSVSTGGFSFGPDSEKRQSTEPQPVSIRKKKSISRTTSNANWG